jgi:hypothetical protein
MLPVGHQPPGAGGFTGRETNLSERLLVVQALPFRALYRLVAPLGILERAPVPTEAEFIAITMKVFLADVVERPVHATVVGNHDAR